jgi:hypothetical protein
MEAVEAAEYPERPIKIQRSKKGRADVRPGKPLAGHLDGSHGCLSRVAAIPGWFIGSHSTSPRAGTGYRIIGLPARQG